MQNCSQQGPSFHVDPVALWSAHPPGALCTRGHPGKVENVPLVHRANCSQPGIHRAIQGTHESAQATASTDRPTWVPAWRGRHRCCREAAQLVSLLPPWTGTFSARDLSSLGDHVIACSPGSKKGCQSPLLLEISPTPSFHALSQGGHQVAAHAQEWSAGFDGHRKDLGQGLVARHPKATALMGSG